MIALLIADMRVWLRIRGFRAAAAVGVPAIVAVILGFLQPLALCLCFCVFFVWIGWTCGQSGRVDEVRAAEILGPRILPFARACEAVILGIAAIVVACPVLVLSSRLWGIPFDVFVRIGLLWLSSAFFTASLCPSSRTSHFLSDRVVALIIVFAWIALSGLLVPLRILNPFFSIWAEFEAAKPSYTLVTILIMTVAGISISAFRPTGRRKGK